MARPKKNVEEIHSQQVSARFTIAEQVRLQQSADAHGVTVSEFLRRTALGHELPPLKTDQEAFAKATNVLLRLGVNLNQIALVANIKEKVLANMLFELMARINHTMDELNESRRN